jgi:hypothetical protein
LPRKWNLLITGWSSPLRLPFSVQPGVVLPSGEAGSGDGGHQRSERDQIEALMQLEPVRPFVESGLIFGASLGLIHGEAQIAQRRQGRGQSQIQGPVGSRRERHLGHFAVEAETSSPFSRCYPPQLITSGLFQSPPIARSIKAWFFCFAS